MTAEFSCKHKISLVFQTKLQVSIFCFIWAVKDSSTLKIYFLEENGTLIAQNGIRPSYGIWSKNELSHFDQFSRHLTKAKLVRNKDAYLMYLLGVPENVPLSHKTCLCPITPFCEHPLIFYTEY